MESTDNSSFSKKLDDILHHVRGQKEELEQAIEDRFNQLKGELQGATLSVTNEVKRIKKDREIQWRSKGNRIQFEFNTEVNECLSQISWALENRKLDYIQELVEEGREKIKQRNKLIKLADSSECGWDTVAQYESNPIASDSEDESKIIKAENRALRKRKQKSGSSGGSRPKRMAVSNSVPAVMYGYGGQRSGVQPQPSGSVVQQQRTFRAYGGQVGQNSGTCFACGVAGHFRRECPYVRGQSIPTITSPTAGKQ